MIYWPRAQPEVNESNIHEVRENNGLNFHIRTVAQNNGKQFMRFQFELFSSI